MASECVKVIVRCRPINDREIHLKCKSVVTIRHDTGECIIKSDPTSSAEKRFTFDGAYDEHSTTDDIYEDIAYPLVEGVLEGYNGTIFAYGQTGSGKSFTMQGIPDPAFDRGIIPRAFDHIFENIQVSESSKYLVHASYLEIYNEEVRDLLSKDTKKKLDLKENADRGVYVSGLSIHPCKNQHDCSAIMDKGWKNRSVGATLMNADSSRSHSIFIIHLERSDVDSGDGDADVGNSGSGNTTCDIGDDKKMNKIVGTTGETKKQRIRFAKLNLVDLAGSERQGKTGATGDRLKEATKINLSLSALGNVISALVDGRSTHIPYRDSKLTRLLQDSLGGNTKTLMIACLSPADNNSDETLSTLRYAHRAKSIRNRPKINEDPKDTMIRQFQEEIRKLKEMIVFNQILSASNVAITTTTTTTTTTLVAPTDDDSELDKCPTKEPNQVEDASPNQASVRSLETEELLKEHNSLKKKYEDQIQATRRELDEMKKAKEETEEKLQKLHILYEEATKQKQLGSDNQTESHLNDPKCQKQSMENTVRETDLENNCNLGLKSEQSQQQQTQLVQQSTLPQQCHEQKVNLENSNKAFILKDSELQNALLRLKELENQVVGGEEVNNLEVKERKKKRKKRYEERTQKFRETLMNKDSDDLMLEIYENTCDKLNATEKKLAKAKELNSNLQQELQDISHEFELDRCDYLTTIRNNEMELSWLRSFIDNIHPLIRKSCNYSNLDRIRSDSKWNDVDHCWTLPKLTHEELHLPCAVTAGITQNNPNGSGSNLQTMPPHYQAKRQSLTSSQSAAGAYFRNPRVDELLNRQGNAIPSRRNNNSNSYSEERRTLQNTGCGGNISGYSVESEEVIRRPVRLEALNLPPKLNKKHSKEKKSTEK